MPSLLANSQTKRTPRPHQQEAISSVVRGLRSADRGQLIMACGTGKTLTSFWIREELESGLTLVLLPSLNLLSQTLKEWESESEELNWICVCSDQSVAKDKDEWVVNASDLGIPVTNDIDTIKRFMVKTPDGVIFATYQSSKLISDAQETEGIPSFDLAISDEAHRCAGVVNAFGGILDDQRIRANKRLFMTATPRIMGIKAKTKALNESIEIACMDDESVFGKVLYELSFSEAIKLGLLCDYKVVVVGVDSPNVQSEIIKKSIISTLSGNRISSHDLANHIALSKAINEYKLNRIITFHNGVKEASDFCDNHLQIINSFNGDIKKIKTGFVCGEMKSQDRNKQINQLKTKGDEVRILSNARCLAEGINIPSLDAIAFIDPRKSIVDIAQAVGRVIRRSEGKEHGYIILPVYLGESQDAKEEINASEYKQIFKVLLALKSQDDSLDVSLNQLRMNDGKQVKRSKVNAVFSKIHFDLPEEISEEFSESLKTMIVKNTTEIWMENYGKLVKFSEDHGHIAPKSDSFLGRWISSQRYQYKQGTLRRDKVNLLLKIGFDFGLKSSRSDEFWQIRYQSLMEYHKIHGHPNVKVKEDSTLSYWLKDQRRKFRDGKLSVDKIEDLNILGFDWQGRGQRGNKSGGISSVWLERYEEVKKHIEFIGHGKISRSHFHGRWVDAQRTAFKEGRLDAEKVKLLEDIKGWLLIARQNSVSKHFNI